MPAREQEVSNHRLDSWKEIANFFGRDERTVKRWEKERSLPVHRMPGGLRSGVFAYSFELSQWLKEPNLAAAESEASSATVAPLPSSMLRMSRIVGLLLLILLAVVVVKHQIGLTSASAKNVVPVAHRPNPEAEDLYLKGRYFWNKRTPEDLNKALDFFTQSIVRDPAYAQAYVGLADCYNLLREYSAMSPNEAYPRALDAAREAVKLDDSSAEAQNSIDFVNFYWSWDAPTAEREFKRAIALNPDYVAAHHWYATFLLAIRRYPEALTEIEKARKLDPASTPIMADKGLMLYLAGQAEDGVALLKQIESTEPAFLSPHVYLAEIYLSTKNYPGYLAESKKAAQLRNDANALVIANAAAAGFAAGGVQQMRESMLVAQKRVYLQGALPAYALAQTYSWLGEKQEALKYLHEAYEQHDSAMMSMNGDHAFDSLRDNPAFNELQARSHQPRLN
jgi:tetratricopeptide (TPR) repeat protein